MPGQVECRSSHSYAEEPTAVHWQGERLSVVAIEKSWHSPHAKHFLVCTDAGLRFELCYAQDENSWNITLT